MLSNQILHKTVQDIKRITGLGVRRLGYGCQMSYDQRKDAGAGKRGSLFLRKALKEPEQAEDAAGLFLVYDEDRPAYILALMGQDPQMSIAGKMGEPAALPTFCMHIRREWIRTVLSEPYSG